jgi:hypothetical protein
VPIGVPGELCIGGTGVAIGYWKMPELTAERFIANPHAGTAFERLYRTGDRARWRNDGTLEHLGRLDDQVKVRGYRIELGEIETVLADHPDVRQAAVRLHQLGPDDVRILAYFVPAKAGIATTSALRKHMRSRLPDYMIPQSFLPIESLPLTPNGKVDRKRLPLPAVTKGRPTVPEALSDPVEIAIAEIWTALINPSRPIGRSDRFFEMGGHSLLALQALRQMESRTGIKMDLRAIFQETLGEISNRCRAQDLQPHTTPIPDPHSPPRSFFSIPRLFRGSEAK